MDGDLVNYWANGTWQDGIQRTVISIQHRIQRLEGLGNAVVPQIPEWIGQQIIRHAEETGYV